MLGRDLEPKTTELSSVLASKDGAATKQHVTHHTVFSRIPMYVEWTRVAAVGLVS